MVRTYGDSEIVRIAGDAQGFIRAIEESLEAMRDPAAIAAAADAELSDMSWDNTWRQMNDLMDEALEGNAELTAYAAVLNQQRRGARQAQA